MAALMYFIPDVYRSQICPFDDLIYSFSEERGIEAAFSDARTRDDVAISDIVGPGPGGLSGCILVPLATDRRRPHVQAYSDKDQTWTEVTPGSLWIGRMNSMPPGPDDLARPRAHNGYSIALGDGRKYTIPIIRRPASVCARYNWSETELPRDWRISNDGSIVERVKQEYEQTWEDTADICDRLIGEGLENITVDLDKQWVMDHCLRILGANYRYGAHEQNVLGLVDSDNWLQILSCAIDMPGVLRMSEEFADASKKNGRPKSRVVTSSTPGDAVATPDIDQVVETST